MNKKMTLTLGLVASLAMSFGAANAEDIFVKALATKFEPAVVFVQPGDTVTWTNMAGHDSVSVEGMIPEGAEPWQSQMGANFTVTLDKEGAYVYKCSPHVSLGMIASIVVGDGAPSNLEAIEASPEHKGMIKAKGVKPLKKALEAR